MADWRVVERTGETLARLLRNHIRPAYTSTVDVRLVSTSAFSALASTTVATVSLLLYQVGQNAELRNAPKRRTSTGELVRQPLPLELCYLVTPWGVRGTDTMAVEETATQEEHRLLGLIMQAFYDHAEVGPSDLVASSPTTPVWAPTDNLQITLETLSIEDHYRIWDAGELGYRLSVPYRVRVVGLDSAELESTPPVVEGTFEDRGRGAA
jgi:hypothetical protein